MILRHIAKFHFNIAKGTSNSYLRQLIDLKLNLSSQPHLQSKRNPLLSQCSDIINNFLKQPQQINDHKQLIQIYNSIVNDHIKLNPQFAISSLITIFNTSPSSEMLDFEACQKIIINLYIIDEPNLLQSEIISTIKNQNKIIQFDYLNILKNWSFYENLQKQLNINAVSSINQLTKSSNLLEALANIIKKSNEGIIPIYIQSQSILNQIKPNHEQAKLMLEKIKEYLFQRQNFKDLIYLTFLHQFLQSYDHEVVMNFNEKISNVASKDLNSSDMLVFGIILSKWIEISGFSSPIDKILHKFDNFLEKVEVKLSLSDRIDLLLKSEKFDFTQKRPCLCKPISEALDQVPKEQLSSVIRSLVNYYDSTNLNEKAIKLLNETNLISDLIYLLQSFVWQNNKQLNSPIESILEKINTYFSKEPDFKIFNHYQLTLFCIFYQMIHTIQLDNQIDLKKYQNIPIAELKKLYFNRTEMPNSSDLSEVEIEIDELLTEIKQNYDKTANTLISIQRIERQVKKSLFSVDFELELKLPHSTKIKYIDVIGGSQFISKTGQSRQLQWRAKVMKQERMNSGKKNRIRKKYQCDFCKHDFQ